MYLWNVYFITKLYLYNCRAMDFHVWLNISFAILLCVPIPERYVHLKHFNLARQLIAVPAGIALFYYDTWLPSITRVLSQSADIVNFTSPYLLEIMGRFFNPPIVAGLLTLYAILFFARKKFKITPFVFLAMLTPLLSLGQSKVPESNATDAANSISGSPSNSNLSAQLNSFYHNEAERTVSFSPSTQLDAPFDVIYLHICSLSWDDIDFTKQRENPLFKHFDIIFSNFNSAASYSGPTAIRLLRSNCGQPSHDALYAPPDQQQCLTMDSLQKIGFERQLAMNHDGRYGNFLDDVRERGGLKATPFEASGLPPYLQSFDGSPIHDDFALLSKWWEKRLQSPTERVALYYNSISLHDGNNYHDNGSNRRQGTLESYPKRLNQLLEDMDRFFSVLQASGRRAVIVFVAEHGASVRGDRIQIAGLREIPTPKITTVPLGIKLIGLPDNPAAKPLVLSEPSSYLAVSQLLANFVTISPFGNNSLKLADYMHDLPATQFVSENDGVALMRRDNQYFVRFKGQEWTEYDTSK
ncbi:MAG: hypothetical protein FD173_317 [Gallionellaceae bacterium]|nr:MAG: hypothetical protein FD173_317 [Gallionellaceae bacterium]